MKRMTLGLTLGAVLALAGCSTMAPKYSQPAIPVPTIWPSGPAYKEGPAKALADIPWQEFFVDKQLQKLIAGSPETSVVAHVEKGVVTAGGLTLKAEVPLAYRESFVSGQWNPTAMLLDRFEEVRSVASRLPYVSGF